jgi:protein gp37
LAGGLGHLMTETMSFNLTILNRSRDYVKRIIQKADWIKNVNLGNHWKEN